MVAGASASGAPSPPKRHREAPPQQQDRNADPRAPEPVRQQQGIGDGAGVRALQLAADEAAGAEQLAELFPHTDAGLYAQELDRELPGVARWLVRDQQDRQPQRGQHQPADQRTG